MQYNIRKWNRGGRPIYAPVVHTNGNVYYVDPDGKFVRDRKQARWYTLREEAQLNLSLCKDRTGVYVESESDVISPSLISEPPNLLKGVFRLLSAIIRKK